MSNIKLVMYNVADTAVVTSSTGNVATALPVTNLQETQRTKVVRTTDTNQFDILVNFSSTQPVSAVCLNRHNLSATATWRVQIYGGENQTGSLLYDSTSIVVRPSLPLSTIEWGVDNAGNSIYDQLHEDDRMVVDWFTRVQGRSAKITITDASNADGYMQAGRLIIGDQMSPAINPSYGMTTSWDESTKQTRSEGGTLRSDTRPQYRTFKLQLENLTPEERGAFHAAASTVGLRKDFLLSIFPEVGGVEERDYNAIVKFTSMPNSNLWAFNLYKTTFNMAEA